MNPAGPIKMVSQLLDLPLVGSDGLYCGIVDDVEFAGSAGKGYSITALLVGPGAYAGRLPPWAMAAVRFIAGDRIVRVPWSQVESVGSFVRLKRPGEALGLAKSETRLARWIPQKGAW